MAVHTIFDPEQLVAEGDDIEAGPETKLPFIFQEISIVELIVPDITGIKICFQHEGERQIRQGSLHDAFALQLFNISQPEFPHPESLFTLKQQ